MGDIWSGVRLLLLLATANTAPLVATRWLGARFPAPLDAGLIFSKDGLCWVRRRRFTGWWQRSAATTHFEIGQSTHELSLDRGRGNADPGVSRSAQVRSDAIAGARKRFGNGSADPGGPAGDQAQNACQPHRCVGHSGLRYLSLDFGWVAARADSLRCVNGHARASRTMTITESTW